ncbi:MAG: hypothetical protein JKY54_11610 [Flavobacteriales bacterium]|nr:hypothetical protein [Flavobacteriales bacterium]
MKIAILNLICLLFITGVAHAQISITWVDSISSDFAFTQNWSYEEGVFPNRHGQISCDGFCPEGAIELKDDTGRIPEDSLAKFYRLVDTSHLYYSLKGQVSAYEFGVSNYINCKWVGKECHCFTRGNAATHSGLVLTLIGDSGTVRMNFVSITLLPATSFSLKSGWIKVDQGMFKKNILKAEFDFNFENHLNTAFPLFWKGVILREIENKN